MRVHRRLCSTLAVGLVAALGACGGGGGGGGASPVVPTIDITALNRDSVAHAAAASILVLSPTGAIPLTPSASVRSKLDADACPSAGSIQVKGRNSTLLATALSAALVRLDLDADGNGSFEATETVSWDWLL